MSRSRLSPGSFAAILCVSLLADPVLAGDVADDPLLEKSREVTALFASEMQSALQQAMATGGPVAAIGVCKETAPEIATRLSAESGADVSRTSLRVRNPDNRATEWQIAVLEQFEADSDVTEHFSRADDNAGRYMKVIPTGAICLNCHGTVLAPDIRRQLDTAYPDDEARDYYLGDVRGAFSVIWPAGE